MTRKSLRPACLVPVLAIGGFALPGPTPACALEGITTTHAYATCPQATSPEPGVIDVHLCKGPASIAVKWFSEPDSSSVALGSAPREEDLGIGSFFEVADSIEWRGPRQGREVVPAAAIVRYSVGRSVSKLDGRRVVIHRLEPTGTSCIMAVIDGSKAGAIAQARALADKHAERFKCGTSKRVGG